MELNNDLMNNRVLALIPARSGSKGVKGKNMIDILGKPLIEYSIDAINESKLISESIVSTDSEYIGEFCESKGVKFPFIRPKVLSNDHAKSIDVVIHALDELENKGQVFDYVLLIQPTSPFRSKNIIDKSIKKLLKSRNNSLISVKAVDHKYNPNWQFKLNQNKTTLTAYEKEITSRRQDLTDTYIRDGSIYITQTNFLRTQNKFFDHETEFIIDSNSPNINIDSPIDLELARDYARKVYFSDRTS